MPRLALLVLTWGRGCLIIISLMCWGLAGCNITPESATCQGPVPRCQCATTSAAACVESQWVCACSARDMSTDISEMTLTDMSGDDLTGDDMDLSPDMPTPDCASLDKTSLPNAWTSLDVDTYEPGVAGYNGREFCIEVASADIWNPQDAFHFVFSETSGDVQIQARVLNFVGVDAYTKVGVMIRKDASSGSPMAFAQTTTTEGEQFSFRARQDLNVVSFDDQTTRRGFIWLRAVKRGDWVLGFTSKDGQSWTKIGETHMPSLGNDVLVGLAASSHDMMKTFVTFDQVSVSKPDPVECPGLGEMSEVCPDVFAGADAARVGGLLASLFQNAKRFDVTNTNDSGMGSLRAAMEAANAHNGYSVVEVAPSLKGKTILIETDLPKTERTWLRGNGVIVAGALEEPPSYNVCAQTRCVQRPRAFSLDSLSILEGFHIRYVQFAVFSRKEGTGIWVHGNTFEYATNVYLDFSGNEGGQRRYLTISDNRFIGSPAGSRSNGIIFQVCAPGESGCDDDPTNMYVSIHHNYFDSAMSNWMPSGGVKLLMYNNFFDDVSSNGLVELKGFGEALSLNNVVRATNMATFYLDGKVQSDGDKLYGATLGGTPGVVSAAPSYEIPRFYKSQVVEFYTTEQSGAPR